MGWLTESEQAKRDNIDAARKYGEERLSSWNVVEQKCQPFINLWGNLQVDRIIEDVKREKYSHDPGPILTGRYITTPVRLEVGFGKSNYQPRHPEPRDFFAKYGKVLRNEEGLFFIDSWPEGRFGPLAEALAFAGIEAEGAEIESFGFTCISKSIQSELPRNTKPWHYNYDQLRIVLDFNKSITISDAVTAIGHGQNINIPQNDLRDCHDIERAVDHFFAEKVRGK